jgi:signal transduction histidine kinase
MTDGARPRLLIVDDEVAHMRALCDTLQDHGYETVGCVNGETGLAALQQARFDLLLADLMMPGMNGIALLRAGLQLDPMLVGIIMTGEGTIGTAVEAMQSGALDYILKPFKLSGVLPVIARGLEMRRLRVENRALEQRVRDHATELEAANRELDAFARSASHDLRSPLNAVLGFTSLLMSDRGPRLSEQQLDWLTQVQRSGDRMLQLIDDLMRLSYAGRQALDLQAVDLVSLIQGVVADLRRQQPQRQVAVEIGELPQVVADASLLRQVFVNLLSNAFKYTRDTEQPCITVGCRSGADRRVFFVRDNGVGFDMAQADRLFGAFQRLHRPDDFEGNGVGLSIVERVVRRHGGRIWAESKYGMGATFFFTLAKDDPAPPGVRTASAAKS